MGETLRADERSQPIMRMPRDKTPGELILDDGEHASVLFFVPHSETLGRIFEDANAFMPVAVGSSVRMVARSSIACIRAHRIHAIVPDADIPRETQRTIVRLRGGTVVRGELRWIAADGHRRTLDHLNDNSTYMLAYDGDHIHFIVKAAVLSVEEF